MSRDVGSRLRQGTQCCPSFNQRLTPEIGGVFVTIATAAVIGPNEGRSGDAAAAKATGPLDDLGTKGLARGCKSKSTPPTQKRVVFCCILQPAVDEVNRAMREE